MRRIPSGSPWIAWPLSLALAVPQGLFAAAQAQPAAAQKPPAQGSAAQKPPAQGSTAQTPKPATQAAPPAATAGGGPPPRAHAPTRRAPAPPPPTRTATLLPPRRYGGWRSASRHERRHRLAACHRAQDRNGHLVPASGRELGRAKEHRRVVGGCLSTDRREGARTRHHQDRRSDGGLPGRAGRQ